MPSPSSGLSTFKQRIDDFLSQESFAIVGASRNGGKFGNTVYKEMIERGYSVTLVHPDTDSIQGVACVRSLLELPAPVGGVIISVPASQAEAVIRSAADAGIPRVWMVLNVSSDAAKKACDERGISYVAEECILMHLRNPGLIHRVHRGARKLFGTMPS